MKEKFFLIVLVFIHLFIISKLVFFPYPELFIYPFLAKGGLLPYKDIFDQHFPSFLMLPFNFYDLGLTSVVSAKLFLTGSVALSHLLIFVLSKKIFGKSLFLVPNLFFVLFQVPFDGRVLWLDSFLAPILLLSFFGLYKFFEKERVEFLVLSGLALGLAFFFKQIILPLILALAIYLYFKTKSLKKVLVFSFFSFLPLGFLVIWILKKDLLQDFFYWTFRFNFEVYAKMAKKLPSPRQVLAVFYLFIPCLWTLLGGIKRKFAVPMFLFLLLPLVGAITRFEFIHIQPAIPFAALFVGSFVASLNKKTRLIFAAYGFLGIFLFATYLRGHVGSEVYFFDEVTFKTAQKVKELTRSDERIFIMGSQPILYPLSQRLPAGRVFTVNVFWNMVVAQDRILDGLERDIPKVVVRDTSSIIDGKKVIDFSQKINSFIEERYIKIDQIGANEILIPKK